MFFWPNSQAFVLLLKWSGYYNAAHCRMTVLGKIGTALVFESEMEHGKFWDNAVIFKYESLYMYLLAGKPQL